MCTDLAGSVDSAEMADLVQRINRNIEICKQLSPIEFISRRSMCRIEELSSLKIDLMAQSDAGAARNVAKNLEKIDAEIRGSVFFARVIIILLSILITYLFNFLLHLISSDANMGIYESLIASAAGYGCGVICVILLPRVR